LCPGQEKKQDERADYSIKPVFYPAGPVIPVYMIVCLQFFLFHVFVFLKFSPDSYRDIRYKIFITVGIIAPRLNANCGQEKFYGSF
jgi:hypothetical protein